MKPKANFNNLPLSRFEKQLNWLSILGLAAHILLVAYHYNQLPDRIPIHFDITGTPDSYGSKGTIWLLVGLATAMYFFMRYVASVSADKYNYPVKITPANAKQQYLISRRMLYLLNTGMVVLFLLISWGIIQTAKGQMNGLGTWFLVATLFLTFAPIVYSLIAANKSK